MPKSSDRNLTNLSDTKRSKVRNSRGDEKRTKSEQLIEKMTKARYGKILPTLELLVRADPEFAAAYEELFELLMTKDRGLDVKTKEFIVMGILASRGQYHGLQSHFRRALKLGITQTEMIEVLQVAMFYGGTESMIRGGELLMEVLDDQASPTSKSAQ